MHRDAAIDSARGYLRAQYADADGRFTLARGHADLISAEDTAKRYDGRATWQVWFFLNRDRLAGVDLFPDYAEVFVDDQTGEAWRVDRRGNRSRTSWRTRGRQSDCLRTGDTPDELYQAACLGNLTALGVLLEGWTDLDQQLGDDDMPALALAADHGRLDAVRLLLDRGANPNGWSHMGETALDYAVSQDFEGIAQLLLDRGANVNACSEGDRMPLHFAAEEGAMRCTRLLIRRGTDVHAKDADGQTALRLARSKGHSSLATLLVEAGASE